MTPNDWMKITGTHGAIGNGESRLLYEEARKVPEGSCIVEIGSWRGKSTVALALGSLAGNRVKVYSVDPHENHEEQHSGGLTYGTDDWHLWAESISNAGCWEVVRPIGLPSERITYDHFCELLFGRVGLAFIDGSHEEEDVWEDLWIMEEINGPIICDDYGMEPVAMAITRFIADTQWKLEEYGAFAILRRD